MDIIDSLKLRNNVMETILTKRLNNIKYVHQTWDNTNVRGSIEALIELHDPAVTVDILKLLKFKLNVINLDTCITLLPILKELLFEIYEEYVNLFFFFFFFFFFNLKFYFLKNNLYKYILYSGKSTIYIYNTK